MAEEMDDICIIDISPFLIKAELIASNDFKKLSLLQHQIAHEVSLLLRVADESDGFNFSISAECRHSRYKDELTQANLDDISTAINFALMDFKDVNSNMHKDVIEPFLQHKNTIFACKFYLENVLTGIALKMYNDTHVKGIQSDRNFWTFEAVANDLSYFRFNLPCDKGPELWNSTDLEMIQDNAPFVHYNLWELGNINIINYILGPYYYHLATYCPNAELARTRHLYEWSFGKA